MKLISWNVNGLRACVTKGFLEYFKEADADIFCIQETKLQEGQIELDLPGYYQYWNYAERKGYSGTAVFTKKEPLSVAYGIGIPEHDKEGRVITLEFPEFYLVTVYTPNSQNELARLDYRMEWEDAFLSYLKKLEEKRPVIFCGDLKDARPSSTPKPKPIIICGDLNVAATSLDLKNPKANIHNAGFTEEEREKFSRLLASGYIDTYRAMHPDKQEFSWWSYRFRARERNAGWRIDYFLVSEQAKGIVTDARIDTAITGSDHAPVLLSVNI